MGVQDDMRVVERITKQLAQLEKIIRNYLSTNPLQEETLKQKIVQFEMIVNCIPVWCSGLWVQEWKDKLASFLEQFETLTKPPPPPPRRDELEHAPMPQVNASSGDLSVMSSSSISLSPTDKSKSLDTQMKNAFFALPRVKNFTDVDKLKQLLALAANCMKIVNEIDDQNSPQQLEDIFRRVMRKMPADLREVFCQRPAWQQSLQELLCFLRTHISHFQSFEIDEVKEAVLEDAIQKLDISDNPPEMCKYCKTFGHEAIECVFIKRKLCFSCFQFGHIATMCNHSPILN